MDPAAEGGIGLGVHRGALAARSSESVFSAERITALTAAVARSGGQAGSMEGAARHVAAAIRTAFSTPDGCP